MPEKHLARQGIFGFLCGLETVLGVVLAQLDLSRANLVWTLNANQNAVTQPRLAIGVANAHSSRGVPSTFKAAKPPSPAPGAAPLGQHARGVVSFPLRTSRRRGV